MVTMEKGIFRSVTGQKLDRRLWKGEGTPKAVLQLVHGMAEHIDRYDAPARALAEAGFVVVGHTHLGHGGKADTLGHFGKEHGWQNLIDDVHSLRIATQSYYPGVPYFILGHSMGSFVTRCYLMEHSEGLAGAILSGTGYFSHGKVTSGLAVSNLVCLFGGAEKPSPLINKLAFSSSNKAFAPARTDFDWLTRRNDVVDQYMDDPFCGFLFTGAGYRDMFRGLRRLNHVKDLSLVRKDLPILLFSGDHDPVGAMGTGVNKVAQQFRDAGVKDVTVKLYEGGRHEMFNEENAAEVYADVAAWVNAHLPKASV